MSNVILMDGKDVSERLCKKFNSETFLNESKLPKLVVITIGDDDASKVYIRNKAKLCEKNNIYFEHTQFSANTNKEIIVNYIERCNKDTNINGVMIQMPVPINFKGLEQYIDKCKDVDGFTSQNLGGLFDGNGYFKACTPKGILTLLNEYNINLQGQHVVILGRSNIVGKPLIGLCLQSNATVTSCNSYTKNLKDITKTADILISAIGKGNYINREFISSRCKCIIDVGMNRDINNKLCGDVNFNDITEYWKLDNQKLDKYITPVPGGVGPMTVYSLIENVIEQYKRMGGYNKDENN